MFSSVAKPAPKKRSRSFEEVLGMKWLPIVGIVAVVFGVGYLVKIAWGSFPHGLRVVILYAGGLALLVGGIFLERKSRYRTLGRALIGGGWAVVALVTYGLANVPPLQVLASRNVDLFLLLAVVGAMVWHTLKYNSQLVTGAGFLLGFIAIGMNPSPPYNLIAGAMVILGMTVLVMRRQWFELEILGILASYGNHILWLYREYGHYTPATLPYHASSTALVIGYWAIFRASYLVRKIAGKEQERVSTFAALLNPILLLMVMWYQHAHPEWAWWFLLATGAVEFTLGQLPVSRRRRAPFQVLSCLGAALMVASVPYKFSGDARELVWLAGAEAFLLAGIFTRERLFRGFGLIISFLVALSALQVRIVPLAQQIANGQPHHNGQTSRVLAVIAAVLYANAHITRRRWPSLFAEELEQQALRALSFAASLFAVAAVYAYVPEHATAAVLALLVAWLSGTGRLFWIPEMTYEAHWVAAVAFIQVLVTDSALETVWWRIPQRVLSFAAVAALFYLSSRFVRLSETRGKTVFFGAYAWAATSLLALLIWFQFQARKWPVAVLWIVLGLALSVVGQFRKRNDLKWQAFALVLISFVQALTVNMGLTAALSSSPNATLLSHVTYRLFSVSLIALGIYLLARWAPVRQIRPVYSVAGTFLLAYLAYKEAPAPWVAVFWIGLVVALALAARWWKDRPLLWQTHLLSALAAGWTLYVFYDPQYRGTRVQWMTVGITAIVLYALTWLTNIRAVIEDERICQAYPWAASLLVSWLAWYQLPPNSVALAWGVFGLLLFEFPDFVKSIKPEAGQWAANWRAQAYVALAGGFVRIFIANINSVGWIPALLIGCMAAIYFFVYWELGRRDLSALEKGMYVEFVMACLGTATLAVLARFELSDPDAVVIGYAGLVVGTLLIAWLARRQVFLFQALVMLSVTAFRISMTNFFDVQKHVPSSLMDSIWAIALLACAVPVAFQARKNALAVGAPGWFSTLARHAQHPMFFVPVALLAVLLFLKLSGGKLTGAWAVEGFAVFVLALWAKERSFRLTGLSLLLVSICKLVYDTFYFENPLIKSLTWIGVGILILVVVFLYGKNREALRDYL